MILIPNFLNKDPLKSQEFMAYSDSLPRIQQKRWKNTWSFNLHGRLPLENLFDNDPLFEEKLKKGIRKYYGKKIQYIIRFEHLNAFISHSKLVKYAEIQKNYVCKNNLKTQGNLVIFGTNMKIEGNQIFLCFKKILKHCQKADIQSISGENIGLIKYMLCLRNLCVDFHTAYLVHSLNGALQNLLNLETIKVEYLMRDNSRNGAVEKKASRRFFSDLHKLSRLKRLRFISNSRVLQDMKQDLEKFYQKPCNFEFYITIGFRREPLEKMDNSLLRTILSAGEYLYVEYWEDFQQPYDVFYRSRFSKEPKKKAGKKNIVEISIPRWKSLLSILSQIKKRCISLQHLSLYLSFDDAYQMWTTLQYERPSFNEIFNLALEEISPFEKLNVFKLAINVEHVNPVILGKILSNSNLETFQLNLDSQKDKTARRKWEKCFMIAKESQVKELNVKISKGVKTHLFERNLLDYVKSLDSLQILELVDENLQVITLDFLNELVTSLLEKKGMRRILICTKVKGNFYKEHVGKFFLKIFGIQRKNKLDEISQDWEKSVRMLKELQLEEILIGKWSGYSFSYLWFNRRMGVTNQLFWTQAEMEDLLLSQKELKNLHTKIFYSLLVNKALFGLS